MSALAHEISDESVQAVGENIAPVVAIGEEQILKEAEKILEHHGHFSSWLGNLFGTIYTVVWAIAWYPQIYANYREKSAVGYCYDLVVYNVYGFILYCIYTVTQYRYQLAYGMEEAVEWQDLFFAFHSLFVNVWYLSQAWYYDGRPWFSGIGWFCKLYIAVTFGGLCIQGFMAMTGMISWVSVPGAIGPNGVPEADWSFVEYMGIVKAVITIIKYPSQVVFNYDRKSTRGMSVLGFVMDMIGGAAALAQNMTDSIIFNDLTFMTANIPKVIVAGSSLLWDSVLIYQGVWCYRNQEPLPEEQRISFRKPDTRAARVLAFFAPAPWPPEQETVLPNEVELGQPKTIGAPMDLDVEDSTTGKSFHNVVIDYDFDKQAMMSSPVRNVKDILLQ